MTPQETLDLGVEVSNRIEKDIRWMIEQAAVMKGAGVNTDCIDKSILHYSRSLDQAKRGHKCIAEGVEAAAELRGPGDKRTDP